MICRAFLETHGVGRGRVHFAMDKPALQHERTDLAIAYP